MCGFDRGGEGVFFAHDVVAAGGEHAEGHVEGGGIATGEDALPVLVRGVVDDLNLISGLILHISQSSTSVCSVTKRRSCAEPVPWQ